MSIARVFQAATINVNQPLILSEDASHHLARVLRAEVGDQVTLFNGSGGDYLSVITEVTKKYVTVDVQQFIERHVEAPIHIHLAQGIARGEKMDIIVQKSVELGVSKITPLVTERCNVRLQQDREEKRMQHWRSVMISACEQSGRDCIPELSSPQNLDAWLKNIKADKCFVLSPHVATKLPQEKLPANASIVLLLGPEGGLSDEEVALAILHGFTPLNLGPRVLRTETATLAAMTVIQRAYGDM